MTDKDSGASAPAKVPADTAPAPKTEAPAPKSEAPAQASKPAKRPTSHMIKPIRRKGAA